MGIKNFFHGKKANSANQSAVNSGYNEWADAMADVEFAGNTPASVPESQRTPEPSSQPEQRKKEVEVVFDSVTGEKLYISKQQAQQNAIINFFQSGQKENKNRPSKQDEDSFYRRLSSNEITIDDEEEFLKTIPRTAERETNGEKSIDRNALNELFTKINNTPGVNQIYKDLVQNHDQVYPTQLSNLLYNYKTPRELNRYAFNLLDEISGGNNKLLAEINVVYEDFKKIVYGEQNEYFESLNALREKARQYAANNQKQEASQNPIHAETFIIPNQNINNLQDHFERKEVAPLPECAAASFSKAEKLNTDQVIIGANFDSDGNGRLINTYVVSEDQKKSYYERYKNRANEDTVYGNVKKRFFAIFDGAGGIGEYGGAYVSNACAEAANTYIESGLFDADYQRFNQILKQQFGGDYNLYNQTIQNYQHQLQVTNDPQEYRNVQNILDNLNPFNKIANAIQRNAIEKGMGGASTGIIAKISEDNKNLDYLNVGDSRLYIIRGGKLIQISEDEGEGNAIGNAFGISDFKQVQFRRVQLQPGDVVFMCSDGVMGDCKEQEISQQNIDNIIKNHKDPQEIVNLFTAASHKFDDTSAIAIRIPEQQ